MLGYRPNPVARNLKSGKTNTVGVIVPEMVTPYAARVVGGIQKVLTAHGIKVILADSEEDPEKEKESLLLIEQFMVDGIIISLCSYKHNRALFFQTHERRVPYRLLRQNPQKPGSLTGGSGQIHQIFLPRRASDP